jgi:plastocyanin domain-containing protein
MSRFILFLLAVPLTLAACGGEPPTERPGAVPARIEAEVQVAEIAVGASGFRPEAVALRAGVPARLVFRRTTDDTCATEVQAPGVPPTPLPLHEPVAIAFTPREGGTLRFACGMDMMEGTLLIQP